MKVHYKMSFATAGVILIFISIYGFVTINRELNQEKERFTGKIKKNNIIVKNTLEEALWNLNDQVIERNMEFFLEDDEITELVLFDNFSFFQKSKNENPRDEYSVVQNFTLKRDDFKIGDLQIVYSNKARRQLIDKHMNEILRITFLIIITIFILNYYILKYLNSPINRLLLALKKVEGGNLAERLDFKSKDEYKTIGIQFNKMVETLEYDRDILIAKEAELKKAKNNAVDYSQKLEKLNEELEEIIAKRTEQLEKEKQRAETANKAKDKFLANISHEMRTPLTPIIGFSKSLLSTLTEEPINSKLGIIRKAGERLLNLTNELLKFSKIEKYEITLTYENFSIRNFIENVHHENLIPSQNKGLNFEFFINNTVPEMIFTDKMKLYEILTNLVQNAIKYTNEGFIMIEIENNSDYLIIDLYDSGIGIAKEKLGIIFDAFEQIDNSTEGVGLGLNIVSKLVEALNGKISIESSVGNGTHFTIKIPLVEKNDSVIDLKNIFANWTKNLSDKRYVLTIKAMLKLPTRLDEIFKHLENEDIEKMRKSLHSLIGVTGNYKFNEIFELAKQMHSMLQTDDNLHDVAFLLKKMKKIIYSLPFKQIFDEIIQGNNLKILIAEDIKENQELIKEILEFSNLELNLAGDGIQALEKIKENMYDVILMDIQMPELNGDEVLQTLKYEEVELKAQIIALTAQALSNDREKYLELGFDDYISKPIDEILLYSKLGEVFDL